MAQAIFVVDDDPATRTLLARYLEREGFTAEAFASAAEVRERLRRESPQLLILDIMMPGEDGLALCRDLRASSSVPIIFVSARGDEVDRVLGLELGADDYLPKPFSPRELVARVKAVLRRGVPAPSPADTICMGNLVVDQSGRQARTEQRTLDLTPKEYDLLLLLARNPRRAFSREEILDRVWGYDYVGDSRAVDDLVKRLRRKLRESEARVEISTVWGHGYRMDE